MVPKELFFFSGKTNKRYHFVVVVVIVMLLYTRKRSNEKEENLFAFAICNYLLKTKKKTFRQQTKTKAAKEKGKKQRVSMSTSSFIYCSLIYAIFLLPFFGILLHYFFYIGTFFLIGNVTHNSDEFVCFFSSLCRVIDVNCARRIISR